LSIRGDHCRWALPQEDSSRASISNLFLELDSKRTACSVAVRCWFPEVIIYAHFREWFFRAHLIPAFLELGLTQHLVFQQSNVDPWRSASLDVVTTGFVESIHLQLFLEFNWEQHVLWQSDIDFPRCSSMHIFVNDLFLSIKCSLCAIWYDTKLVIFRIWFLKIIIFGLCWIWVFSEHPCSTSSLDHHRCTVSWEHQFPLFWSLIYRKDPECFNYNCMLPEYHRWTLLWMEFSRAPIVFIFWDWFVADMNISGNRILFCWDHQSSLFSFCNIWEHRVWILSDCYLLRLFRVIAGSVWFFHISTGCIFVYMRAFIPDFPWFDVSDHLQILKGSSIFAPAAGHVSVLTIRWAIYCAVDF